MAGRPMIDWLWQRLSRHLQIPIWIATSDDPSDDPLADHAMDQSWPYFRGSLDDVAGRFLELAMREKLEAVVRISGDSPLMDPELIQKALEAYGSGNFDLSTNIMVRSYPKGMSVEVIRTSTLARLYPDMSPEDREHVTPAFYRNPERFSIYNFETKPSLAQEQWSVDTAEDFTKVESTLERLPSPLDISFEDLKEAFSL